MRRVGLAMGAKWEPCTCGGGGAKAWDVQRARRMNGMRYIAMRATKSNWLREERGGGVDQRRDR